MVIETRSGVDGVPGRGAATTLTHCALSWWELSTRRGALAPMALVAVGAILIADARG